MPELPVSVGSRLRRLRSHPAVVWRTLHYLSLVAGLVGLLLLARGQWFYFDEWDIIWRPEGLRRLVEGHNGHWSLVPIVVWIGLQTVFGLGSYLPFMVVAIVAHLVVAHLLWRVLLCLQVDPWIATAAGTVFVFFGAAWENLTWAFQMGFVGAIAFALGALLVAMRPRLGGGAVSGIAILLILGVASAGTALPFLPVVLVAVWQRHGWRRAVVAVGVPVVVYLGWFALIAGPNPTTVYRASGVATSLIGIPQFAATMLVGSWTAAAPVPEFGLVMMTGLSVGALILLRRRDEALRNATLLALAGAGVLFALLTAYSRLGLGLASATEPRYVYLVVLTTLPAACVLLTSVARGAPARLIVLALMGVVFVYNVGLLGGGANTGSARETSTHALVSAALSLADEHPHSVDPDARPDPVYVPRTLHQLEVLERDDGLTTIPYDDATHLTALVNVGILMMEDADATACLSPVTAGEALPTDEDGLVVSVPGGGELTFALRQNGVTGASRTVDLDKGVTKIAAAEPADLVVVTSPDSMVLCSD